MLTRCKNFVIKKVPSDVNFTFLQTFDQNFVFFTEWGHVDRQCEAQFSQLTLFSVSGLKDEKLIKQTNLHKN